VANTAEAAVEVSSEPGVRGTAPDPTGVPDAEHDDAPGPHTQNETLPVGAPSAGNPATEAASVNPPGVSATMLVAEGVVVNERFAAAITGSGDGWVHVDWTWVAPMVRSVVRVPALSTGGAASEVAVKGPTEVGESGTEKVNCVGVTGTGPHDNDGVNEAGDALVALISAPVVPDIDVMPSLWSTEATLVGTVTCTW
jgi:hypothetical protein